MPDRFNESDTENGQEFECLHEELHRISRVKRIGCMRSSVNKTPIRYERESDTKFIHYRLHVA